MTKLEEYSSEWYHYSKSYLKKQMLALHICQAILLLVIKHYGMLLHKKFQWMKSMCRKNVLSVWVIVLQSGPWCVRIYLEQIEDTTCSHYSEA